MKKLGLSRRFNGKVYQSGNAGIRGWNKTQANKMAADYRRKGYLVRIVKSSNPALYGYSVWWRAERGHGY